MATKKEEVYECQVCSNVIKVINAGVGTLVCCEKPMKLRENEK